MRNEMPHPCMGSRSSVLRISRSRVPCKRSLFGFAIHSSRYSTEEHTVTLVDCQEKRFRWTESFTRLDAQTEDRKHAGILVRHASAFPGEGERSSPHPRP